ncbi:uncharacterized protein KY384_000435 [Bacidia gigantensis]|uniref:uncharacterized protein n=1 Tax=Bacidia gigantensis TaxID=2732470 RepID=UPI001D03A0BA|nr:uncharacterized protein KY384_000435 [Bacidia gigantensis]KAG8525675.1 hypothetical protein KY384_000435 [Bacidia gigantensis]
MEVVAATASVAGILTVVGNGIESIIKLKEFYAALVAGSRTIEKFLKDINDLLQTLHGIRELLNKWPKEKTDVNIAALSVQVEECSKDLFNWLDTAKAMRPASSKGGMAWFKKFWIATNKNKVNDIRTEIGRHKQTLNISLTLIGRAFDVHVAKQMTHVDDKVKELTVFSTSAFDYQQREAERMESFRHASSASNAGSMQSLQSMASSLSRIEARLSISGATSPWVSKPSATKRKASFSSEGSHIGSPGFSMDLSTSWGRGPSQRDGFADLDELAASTRYLRHEDSERGPSPERGQDGLYHCQFEVEGCNHPPEKLRCNYEKHLNTHLKPYRCKFLECSELKFGATAVLLRHERESHGLHGHGNKPYLCLYTDCERSQPGQGFPRQWNLRDHLRRVHNHHPKQGKREKHSSPLSSPALSLNADDDLRTENYVNSGSLANQAGSYDFPLPKNPNTDLSEVSQTYNIENMMPVVDFFDPSQSFGAFCTNPDFYPKVAPAEGPMDPNEVLGPYDYPSFVPEVFQTPQISSGAHGQGAMSGDQVAMDVDGTSAPLISTAEGAPPKKQWPGTHLSTPSLLVKSLEESINDTLAHMHGTLEEEYPGLAADYYYVSLSQLTRFVRFQLGSLRGVGVMARESAKPDNLSQQINVKLQELDILERERDRVKEYCNAANVRRGDLMLIDRTDAPMTTDFGSTHPKDESQEISGLSKGKESKSHEMFGLHETILESNLLGHWTGKRDRINRWLLHSLLTDEGQAQNHKSATSSEGLDEASWVRLVLQYWFVDEAATGVEIASSLSGGAVASKTGSSLDSIPNSKHGRLVEEKSRRPPLKRRLASESIPSLDV